MPSNKFSEEFKAEAVRAVLTSSRSISSVAREKGIGFETLRSWVINHRRDQADAPIELADPGRDELPRLRQENRDLKAERDLLAKAAVYFARQCG